MFTLAVLIAFTTAAVFYPALAFDRRVRPAILVLLMTIVLLTPLVIPPDQPISRLLAAVLAVALSAKLYDLHVGADRGHRPDFGTFLAFLPNPASVVLRKLDHEPRPNRRDDFIRLLISSLKTVSAAIVLVCLFLVDWRQFPLAIEHSLKVVTFFLTLVPGSAAAVAAMRLLGLRAREPMDNPFAARTPADFWTRYNRPAQQFFYEDVFKPLGGLRAPIRSTVGTFAVSGVFHEYLFDITVGRLQGYQMAFFMIQGLAVAATLRVRPRGWRALPWVAATFVFNLATSTLFFASVNEVLPFYSRQWSE